MLRASASASSSLTRQTVLRRRRANRLVVRIAVPGIWALVITSALVGPLVQRPFCASVAGLVALTPTDVWLGRVRA